MNVSTDGNYTGPILCRGSADHSKCTELVNETFQVAIAFLVVMLLLLGLFYVDYRWKRIEQGYKKASELQMSSHTYAMNLVRHFMPTMKVAKHQFRGMQPPPAKVDVAFEKLGLVLHSGDTVLNGVTGEFQAGRMCAIMGPSGAGKTTFMNVLCGKATYGKMTGKILVNNKDVDMRAIGSVTGFVPQDDIVHETLTVREQITFSARLRNKAGTSARRIGHIVDDVLNVMQIDHIQDKEVGGVETRGISGGQRKRVNIGLELAAQPTLLFLDEPTSGLDSTSSLAVVYSLKKMCELGMTCIMVIHQPRYSLFTLFDDVLLLGKGGNTVYLGDSSGAKTYFDDLGFVMEKDENRADWFMDVISGEVPNKKIPSFEPRMLFQLWEQYVAGELDLPSAHASLEAGQVRPTLNKKGSRLSMGKTGRELSPEEEVAMLTRLLNDEWDRIDLDFNGELDEAELKSLLLSATQLEPSDEIVQRLLGEMSGGDSEVIQKTHFIRYLCSLQSDIAADSSRRANGDASPDSNGLGQSLLSMMPPLANTRRFVGDSSGSDSSESESTDESSGESVPLGSKRNVSMATTKSGGGLGQGLTRRTPSVMQQYHILGIRTLVQWWRRNHSRMIFFAAMGLGAIILAAQDTLLQHPTWDAMAFVNTHTCIGLLTTIFCLNVFGENQPMFWRERNRGMSVFAHFTSKANWNAPDLLMQVFLFTALYYVIRTIHVPFLAYVVPYALVAYAASGWGYAISAWLPAQHGPFVASLVMFVVCGLLGNPMSLAQFLTNPILEVMVDLISITRWSIPMSFYLELQYPHEAPKGLEKEMYKMYNAAFEAGSWPNAEETRYWMPGIMVLISMGVVLRLIAFAGLCTKNRDKMV